MNSSTTPQTNPQEEKRMTVPLIDKQIKNTRNMPTMLFIVKKKIILLHNLIGKCTRIC